MKPGKTCNGCNIYKNKDAFYSDKSRYSGLSHRCKECKRAENRQSYRLDPGKHLKRNEKWNKSTEGREYNTRWHLSAKGRARREKYYRENREYFTYLLREYYKENKWLFHYHALQRQKYMKQATPTWADLHEIQQLYKERERITEQTGIEYHVDHIIPLRGKNVCGLHCRDNLQIITADHNKAKRNFLLED